MTTEGEKSLLKCVAIGCDCILIELVAIPAQTILVHIPYHPPTTHPCSTVSCCKQLRKQRRMLQIVALPEEKKRKKGELLVAPLWRMTGTQQLCSLTHPFTHPPTSQPNNLHTHAHTHTAMHPQPILEMRFASQRLSLSPTLQPVRFELSVADPHPPRLPMTRRRILFFSSRFILAQAFPFCPGIRCF